MSCMGIFIFLGILNIVANFYHDNRLLESIATILNVILPGMIAYLAGLKISNHNGGIIGLLAAIALIVTPTNASIIGAFLIGSIAGLTTNHVVVKIIAKIPPGFELLFTNLIIGIFGFGIGLVVQLVLIPILNGFGNIAQGVITYLIANELLAFLAIFIEVSKVFFLNNIINHGILIPLGLLQVSQEGKTLLFFLETNPGPGAGVILALLFTQKREIKQMFSYFLVQFFGGIHEVYFPLVLEIKKLFLALVLGGMAGIIAIESMDLGLVSPVSPGSVFTLMLNASNTDRLAILVPILISLIVSFFTAVVILQISSTPNHDEKATIIQAAPIHKIVFTCDGGFGSSVMGSSLLKRKIKKYDFNLEIKAQSINEVDNDADLIVVQKGLYPTARDNYPNIQIYPVNEFLDNASYDDLVELIKERNGNNEF